MPSLGATMESGTLLEWKVHPGDHVDRGDIVAVVDTEKAAIEIEIFDTGVIDEILVAEGEKVPVGTVLATVRAKGERASEEPVSASAPTRTPPAVCAPAPPPPVAAASPEPVPSPAERRQRISPAARRRAHELSVDPSTITGSGPAGAVMLQDIEAAALPKVPADKRRVQVMRALGAAMAQSKREIPHYYLASEIDVGRAQDWLAAENARRPVVQRLLFAALLYKAVALSLKQVPVLNGYYKDGEFTAATAVHLGIGISLRHGGTVSPAVHDADRLSLGELMAALSDLVRRTRAGTLRGSEISDSTVTVTSLGDTGADTVLGVIYPPQVALIGFAAIRLRPWIVDGSVTARPIITASLSADHRASEGRQGARFLEYLADHLNRPEDL